MKRSRAMRIRLSVVVVVATLFALMVSGGCSFFEKRVPPEIIPDSLLVEVLADFFIAEGAVVQLEYLHRKQPNSGVLLYQAIFDKHNVTREQVIKSIEFYAEDPEKIDRIYDLVILELNRRQEEIGSPEKE